MHLIVLAPFESVSCSLYGMHQSRHPLASVPLSGWSSPFTSGGVQRLSHSSSATLGFGHSRFVHPWPVVGYRLMHVVVDGPNVESVAAKGWD